MRARMKLFAAAIAIPLLSTPATADISAEAAAVWQRHVERAVAGDLDGVMEDFGEDSVVITIDGVLAGKDAIRGFFEEFLGGLDDEAIASITVNAETIHGDVVVLNFTVGAVGLTFHDTAVIRDNRIRVLATVGYPAQ